MSRDPLRGNLFENAVLLELKKERLNRGLDPNLFYYRDVQKNEVDILYKNGNILIPIEVKSSKTYHSEFLKKLHFFQSIAKERAPKAFLLYAGDVEQKVGAVEVLHYQHASKVFQT